jgi:protein SCO1/2
MAGSSKPQRLRMDSRKKVIVGVAVITIVTGVWLSFWVTAPMPRPQTATVLPAPLGLAEFSLLDQNGDAFSRASFGGHWNLVFFGFTNCPDICPLTLQVLANARQQMLDAGAQELPRIVLVSVDPERDTPEIISQYVGNFGAGVIGVTGEIAEIRKLTDGLGVFFEKTGVDDGDYSVSHSAVVIVIDPQSNFHALFSAPHDAASIEHDLPIIMASQ